LRRRASCAESGSYRGRCSPLALHPDAAIHALPPQLVGRALEDVRLEPVRRLEFEVEQLVVGIRSKPVLRLGRDEHHRAWTDRLAPFWRLDRPSPFHDEV